MWPENKRLLLQIWSYFVLVRAANHGRRHTYHSHSAAPAVFSLFARCRLPPLPPPPSVDISQRSVIITATLDSHRRPPTPTLTTPPPLLPCCHGNHCDEPKGSCSREGRKVESAFPVGRIWLKSGAQIRKTRAFVRVDYRVDFIRYGASERQGQFWKRAGLFASSFIVATGRPNGLRRRKKQTKRNACIFDEAATGEDGSPG